MLELYHNTMSSCAQKVRVALAEKGLEWESHADDADIHTSFNAAAEHVEKQIRRQKRKIRDHHKGGGDGIAAGED